MMTSATRRSIVRWIHLVFALPLLGYVYGPPEEVAQYVHFHRYLFVPVVVATGLWLWKGDALLRRLSKSSG
jgi:hypothetical protein